MQPTCDTGEPVTTPAVTQGDRDREHARPVPSRHAIEVAYEFGEKVVRIEFVDEQLHQRARPRELRRA